MRANLQPCDLFSFVLPAYIIQFPNSRRSVGRRPSARQRNGMSRLWGICPIDIFQIRNHQTQCGAASCRGVEVWNLITVQGSVVTSNKLLAV